MNSVSKWVAASLLLAAVTGAAQAADEVVPAPPACPGAASWSAAHLEESDEAMARRDATRTFAEPALRAELAERAAIDQKLRACDWSMSSVVRWVSCLSPTMSAW